MPSGGVSIDNVDQWIEKGAFAVGMGSALTKGVKNGDYSSVENNSPGFHGKNSSSSGEITLKKIVTLGRNYAPAFSTPLSNH